jgi:hypothetical protein
MTFANSSVCNLWVGRNSSTYTVPSQHSQPPLRFLPFASHLPTSPLHPTPASIFICLRSLSLNLRINSFGIPQTSQSSGGQ